MGIIERAFGRIYGILGHLRTPSRETPLTGNKFGTEAANYTVGRKPYPEEVFSLIKEWVSKWGEVDLLDLGCGNGRATLELIRVVTPHVTGYDIDPGMLEEAVKNGKKNQVALKVQAGEVKHLAQHFARERFKAATAFSCFHWFSTPEEIQAIRSVLDPKGVFIVVKGDGSTGEFREIIAKCREITYETIGRTLIRNKHDAEEALEKNGFEVIETKKIASKEVFTAEELIANVKSRSTWAELTEAEKQRVSPLIERYVRSKLPNGTLSTTIDYKCTLARPR